MASARPPNTNKTIAPLYSLPKLLSGLLKVSFKVLEKRKVGRVSQVEWAGLHGQVHAVVSSFPGRTIVARLRSLQV